MAHAVDPISHHHPAQERQPTAMPELSYHQPHHVFVDFKKAFDRVWHATLWATMRQYINANLVRMIQNLYGKATSTILLNNSKGDWFRTTVGVRQGCVLSPTLFNIVLERIMTDALNDNQHWWQKKYKLAFCRRHRRPGRNGRGAS